MIRTEDPKKVIATFGILTISGYAEGTFITIEPSGVSFEKRQGAGGEVDRINKNNTSYKITFSLMGTSAVNDQLSALLIADERTSIGKLPFMIKDLAGTSVLVTTDAWIMGWPNRDRADSLNSVQWVIETGPGEYFMGGNGV